MTHLTWLPGRLLSRWLTKPCDRKPERWGEISEAVRAPGHQKNETVTWDGFWISLTLTFGVFFSFFCGTGRPIVTKGSTGGFPQRKRRPPKVEIHLPGIPVTFPSARPSEIIYGMAVGDGRKGPGMAGRSPTVGSLSFRGRLLS